MPATGRVSLPIVRPADRHAAAECDESAPHPNEFPPGASAWDDRLSRRTFLSLAGASLALAGVTGCSDKPDEPIVPYVDPPEGVVPGEPQFFATTLTRHGYGRGVIVTSREGRPVKIEGNPDHPASVGAADAQMQAAVLGLYDPRRSSTVLRGGQASTWGAFTAALNERLATHDADGGAGLAILTDAIGSPTVAALFGELHTKFPNMLWEACEPNERNGDDVADLVYDFAAADVIVSFDSDFLTDEPGSLAYARQFSDRRKPTPARPAMNRLYVAEADFSITGSRADHRVPATPSRVERLIVALAAQFEIAGATTPADLSPAETAWLSAVSQDLHAHRGRSLVIAGPWQSTLVKSVADALNAHLGNTGRTVRSIERVMFSPSNQSSSSIADRFDAGTVKTLLILADNPVRTLPGDMPLAKRLETLNGQPGAFTAHLGLYANETAAACQWHVPAQHELEQWGDARAFDGTASIVQPLIAPLTNGRSAIDVLNTLLGRPDRSAYDTVRQYWRQTRPSDETGADFDALWSSILQRGVIDHTAAEDVAVEATPPSADFAVTTKPTGIEVVFRPDPSIGDGRLFHNPWLQELPRPLTKIVWGNAALISPATAEQHRLTDGDVIRLERNGRAVEGPVLVVRGLADAIVVHTGYGQHQLLGRPPDDDSSLLHRGFDVYPLRSFWSPGSLTGVTLTATGRREDIVRTHGHHDVTATSGGTFPNVQVIATPKTSEADLRLRNRKLVRTAELNEFVTDPHFAARMDDGEVKQLYPSWNYDTGPQWGMTIDLNACIGCQACVVACQAENNTPTVGPEQVAKQREMHWLRIDSYVDETARVHHQPVPCMHCENAPCEYVCPVAATTHSVDGLNQMTYNRCVGTRYCSNNCPYKVRRFNFLNYTANTPATYAAQRNPDVTIRTRGVMEKCTYCVQRLVYADRKAEIAALNAGDEADAVRRQMLGRVQTACQQTCPTQAISFGNLADKTSAVYQAKHDPRNYGILTELSTKPRTTYLAAVSNPSAAMETSP